MKNMSTENSEQKIIDTILLSKKRDLSEIRHKSKRRKKLKKSKKHKPNNLIYSELLDDDTKIKLINKNIRHFFHINWDDDIYTKETKKISESIDGVIYWHLINSSYFIEENIQDYIKVLHEQYLRNKHESDNKREVDNEILKDLLSVNNENSNSLSSFDIYNCNDNNNNKIISNNDKTTINFRSKIETFKFFKSIMSYLDYDKKGNYFMNVLGYSSAKSNLNFIKEKLKKYITFFNHINKSKIKYLEEKAKKIEEEYKMNNTCDDNDFIKCINEDPLYTKNAKSYSVNNKFLNYVYNKEKNYYINQDKLYDEGIYDKNIYNINKDGEIEIDDEYATKCFVCNNGDLNLLQYYYECEQCGIRVHPLCYGIKAKEIRKSWRCDKCKEMTPHEVINLECILCPIKGGALKKFNTQKNPEIYQKVINIRNKNRRFFQTNNSTIIPNANNKNEECAWVHLSCALWNKDIKFGNYELKTNIFFDNENIYNNYNSLCDICNKDNCGPTLKCKIEGCKFQCHPECARLNNFYLEVEIINKKYYFNLYCHNHHPNRLAKIINNNIKYCTDLVYNFGDSLNRIFHIYKSHYKKDFYNMEGNDNLNLIEIPINIDDDDNSEDIEDNEDEKNNISEDNNHNDKQVSTFSKVFKGDKGIIPDDKYYKKTLSIFEHSCSKKPKARHNSNLEVKNKNEKNKSIYSDYSSINDNNKSENYENDYNINNSIRSQQNDINSYHYDRNDNSILFLKENLHNKNNISNFNDSFINDNNSLRQSNIDNRYQQLELENNINNMTLEEEINKNKKSFVTFLIGFLNDYYKNNRIIITKGDGCYQICTDDDENNLLYYLNNDTLLENIPLNEIQYNGLSINLIKKYIEKIFPDENSFKELFLDQIDTVLTGLKKNEKYKNREIICRNGQFCKGSKNGLFKLSSIDQFKYQIVNNHDLLDISKRFICYYCANNIQNI